MTTQIINNECWLSVNLNLLVKKRAEIQGIIIDDDTVDELANEMRTRATLDFLFEEVDNMLLVWGNDDGQYMGQRSLSSPPELITYDILEGNGWELKVPRRPSEWISL